MHRFIGILCGVAVVCASLGTVLSGPVAARAAGTAPPVTRSAFIVEMASALHLQPAPSAVQVFKDLPASNPSFGLIMAAYQAGWISGFPDGTFRPGDALTREQVAKSEILALGLSAAAAKLAGQKPTYGDATAIGQWAWGYINECAAIGILRGFPNGDFEPQASFTSAQIVHAEAQMRSYLATVPVGGLTTAPVASPGSAVGTTTIAATPNVPGDALYAIVSGSEVATPGYDSMVPAGAAPYASGQSLPVTAGAYVGIFEAAAGEVVAFTSLQITGQEIDNAPTQLTLTGPSTASAGATAQAGPFTVGLEDAYGDPSAAPAGGETVFLASNSIGTHEFAASTGGPSVASVVIPQGATSATFYYGDTAMGTAMLTAEAQGLNAATASLEVTGGTPARVVLTGPGTGGTTATADIGPFTVNLLDVYGNPAPAPSGGLSISLGSTSTGANEFAASANGTPATSLTIPAGQTSGTFYYGDSVVGNPTITASAPGLPPMAMSLQITQTPVVGIAVTGPHTGAVDTTADIGPYSVTLCNAAGSPVPAPAGGVPVTLGVAAQGAVEFAATSGGAPIGGLTVPAGSTSATFYLGVGQGGRLTVSATAPGLPTASEMVEVGVALDLTGRGLDSPVSPATPSQVTAWYQEGYRVMFLNTYAPSFALQYQNILDQMDAALFQGYYTPAFTDETGAQRAQQAIQAAQEVGYPKGAYIFVDVESTGGATQQQLITWINSWSAAVQAAGYGAGVYFGVPQPVTAAETTGLLADRFWKSLSSNSITPTRGTCVVQTGGTAYFDTDVFGVDNMGGYCVGAGL